jgi:ketosteroid isomerase-like protein
VKQDEPKIRDLAETLVRAERQNDVAAAKALLAEDVVVVTSQQEARGKDAAAIQLQEAIRMSAPVPANDGPLRFDELETIGDWAYFRLVFSGGAWPGHFYLRSIAHKERNERWCLKRISLARAA